MIARRVTLYIYLISWGMGGGILFLEKGTFVHSQRIMSKSQNFMHKIPNCCFWCKHLFKHLLFVKVDSVMMLSSSVTTTTRMLPVFACMKKTNGVQGLEYKEMYFTKFHFKSGIFNKAPKNQPLFPVALNFLLGFLDKDCYRVI